MFQGTKQGKFWQGQGEVDCLLYSRLYYIYIGNALFLYQGQQQQQTMTIKFNYILLLGKPWTVLHIWCVESMYALWLLLLLLLLLLYKWFESHWPVVALFCNISSHQYCGGDGFKSSWSLRFFFSGLSLQLWRSLSLLYHFLLQLSRTFSLLSTHPL